MFSSPVGRRAVVLFVCILISLGAWKFHGMEHRAFDQIRISSSTWTCGFHRSIRDRLLAHALTLVGTSPEHSGVVSADCTADFGYRIAPYGSTARAQCGGVASSPTACESGILLETDAQFGSILNGNCVQVLVVRRDCDDDGQFSGGVSTEITYSVSGDSFLVTRVNPRYLH